MLAAVSAAEVVEARPARRSLRALRFTALLTTILALLFGVPWWTLVVAGSRWPTPVVVAGTAGFLGALVAFPVLKTTVGTVAVASATAAGTSTARPPPATPSSA